LRQAMSTRHSSTSLPDPVGPVLRQPAVSDLPRSFERRNVESGHQQQRDAGSAGCDSWSFEVVIFAIDLLSSSGSGLHVCIIARVSASSQRRYRECMLPRSFFSNRFPAVGLLSQ
jgi:hypothetical protein